MSFIKLNEDHLGQFLSNELLKVVKEVDPFFEDFDTFESLVDKSVDTNKKNELKISRFYALCLELYNCAQRFCESSKGKNQSVFDGFSKMFLSSKFSKKEFDEFIKNFTLEFVFTAHPTEVFPLAIVKAFNEIESLMGQLYTSKDPETRHRQGQNLRSKLTALWLTDELNRKKPTPQDEADRLFYIFETSLWKASPYFNRRYYFEYKKHFESSPKHYPKLKFSSWIGGDRDGNPFVTAKFTEQIIRSTRRKTIRLVMRELYRLREELLIKSSNATFYKESQFPYKSLVQEMIDDLSDHLKKRREDDVQELEKTIKEKIRLIYKTLCKDKAKRIADRNVRSLMDRLNTFGLSPLQLDIRQDSEVHTQLLKELKDKQKKPLSKLSKDVLDTLNLAKKIQPCPFNGYIISMTRSEKDIQNLSDIMTQAKVDLDIIPLFETPDDIRNSLKTLKNNSKSSSKQKVKQVMWGYSDSTKKGGRLASTWSVFKAQEEVLKSFPELVHFHGRGGSIARGGGPVKQVFKLLPPGLSKKQFRQTFQGEVLQDDFGLRSRTVKTLEEYFVYSCKNTFSTEKISKKLRKTLDDLSKDSESKFKKDFYENEKLGKAFDAHSPIDIISTLNLGSRPSKRATKKMGVSYRAIPWVFSWAQTRGSLPIWYGLQGLSKKLYNTKEDSSFTSALIKLLTLGLEKTDPHIFELYFDKKLKTVSLELKEVKKHFHIKTKDKESIKEKIIFRLHTLQVKLLNKMKKSDLELECEKVVTKGIASYLGKSG